MKIAQKSFVVELVAFNRYPHPPIMAMQSLSLATKNDGVRGRKRALDS
jgi:hypothetical protein